MGKTIPDIPDVTRYVGRAIPDTPDVLRLFGKTIADLSDVPGYLGTVIPGIPGCFRMAYPDGTRLPVPTLATFGNLVGKYFVFAR